MDRLSSDERQVAVSLTRDELVLVTNALNEVCNGVWIEDWEFSTRLGRSRDEARALLKELGEAASQR